MSKVDKFKYMKSLAPATDLDMDINEMIEIIESLEQQVAVLTDSNTDVEAFKGFDTDLLIKIICQRDKLHDLVSEQVADNKRDIEKLIVWVENGHKTKALDLLSQMSVK